MRLEHLLKKPFYKNTLIMLIAGVMSNGLNYLYQLLMGRFLAPMEYGELLSLLSLFYIFSVAFTTINTSITKFVSVYSARGQFGLIKSLVIKATKTLLPLGIFISVTVTLLSSKISRFLQISNSTYIILVFASVPFGLVLPVYQGVLRGLQRFGALGISTVSWSFFKLVFSTLLVVLGYGVLGGVGGVFISHVLSLILTVFFIVDILEIQENYDIQLREVINYSWGAFIALFAYTTLWNADMIIVKHYLPPKEAGIYSAISVLGKVALFAPGAIGMVILPTVSELHEKGHETLRILVKGTALAGFISSLIVVAYILFPEQILKIIYGKKYLMASPYLWKYSLAMMFLAMTSVTLNYALSTRRFIIGPLLMGSLIIEIVTLSILHSTLGNILNTLIIIGLVTFIISLLPVISRGANNA